MALLIWEDSYSVGVKKIDEQHKKIFDILNQLYTSMQKLEEEKILKKILNDLADYIIFHFSTEEKYFEKFNYDQKDSHMSEHKEYVDKIKSFQNDFQNNKEFLSFEVIDFLEDWILNHVIGSDKEYTKCFNDNGLF